jgi:hypothetical protein
MTRPTEKSGSEVNLHCFVSGHGFSRADNARVATWALAPAGSFLRIQNNLPAAATGEAI